MNNRIVKKMKKIVRVNYDDLIVQLYDETWFTRLKFAYRILANKKPFQFKWK